MHARPNGSLTTAQHRNHFLSLLAWHETESFRDALTLSGDQSIEVHITAHSRAGGGVHAREHSAGITVSDHNAVGDILALEHINDVCYVCGVVNMRKEKMYTLSEACERR